jgi:hypothetical protein
LSLILTRRKVGCEREIERRGEREGREQGRTGKQKRLGGERGARQNKYVGSEEQEYDRWDPAIKEEDIKKHKCRRSIIKKRILMFCFNGRYKIYEYK